MSDDEGHNYTFTIPDVPWHNSLEEDFPEEDVKMPAEWYGDWSESKAYLEEVRELLLHIMSNRHNPKDVWECASEALRLVDTNETR